MSHAIDRQEISDTLYLGLLKPQQGMPPKGSQLWEDTKHVAQLYTEHDPDKSNRLLDEMGLTWDRNQTYRLTPDGKELFIPVYTYQMIWAEELEMMMEGIREVGIHVELKVIEGSAIGPLANSNQIPIFAIGTITSDPLTLGWMFDYTGWIPGPVLWKQWYQTEGREGVKPDMPDMLNIYTWRRALNSEPNAEKRRELRKNIILTFREGCHNISSLETLPEYWLYNAKLRNIAPDGGVNPGMPAMDVYRPETYFFSD
jgi:peptide/nickel transport system substrate-binding protein